MDVNPQAVTGEHVTGSPQSAPGAVMNRGHVQPRGFRLKNQAESTMAAHGMDPESRCGRKADTMTHIDPIVAAPVQKVVVVNGNTEVLGMLETVLDAGRYDMVFV